MERDSEEKFWNGNDVLSRKGTERTGDLARYVIRSRGAETQIEGGLVMMTRRSAFREREGYLSPISAQVLDMYGPDGR
jgi:hypothetical protein